MHQVPEHHRPEVRPPPLVTPSYLRSYHRRRTAAACTAIRSAASACLRQGITPTTSPDRADLELANAWTAHLPTTDWQDRTP